jgi:DNA-directed RNA polymerase subunit alpha
MKKLNTAPYIPTTLDIENISHNLAMVSIYPFESGFAITVAHPIRRLLLSATAGCAPIGLKIEGVTHEFDAVRGMLEDVSEFILNLKNIRFKIKGDSKKASAKYEFVGPKELTSDDLESSEIEVVTKDRKLATLNEDGKIQFELLFERGMGYVPSEDIRELIDSSYIPLDACFMPVKKAIYEIQNILVEDSPNFEKIVFTIETDGQDSAEQIFHDAVGALFNQLSILGNEPVKNLVQGAPQTEVDGEFKKLLTPIEDLKLSARSHNSLARAEIKFFGDLALMDEKGLAEIRNLGKRSLDEIKEKMEELGYAVGSILPDELVTNLKAKLAQLKEK